MAASPIVSGMLTPGESSPASQPMEQRDDPVAKPGRGARLSIGLIVGGVLLAHALLAVSSVWNKSPAFDEGPHLTSGVSLYKTGDYRLIPEAPPLTHLWAAAPLLCSEVTFPSLNQSAWWSSDPYIISRQFLFECRNNAQTILNRARIMMVMLSVALGFVVWSWSRRLFGECGALVSLTLYAFHPTLLAHGQLVTTDQPAAMFFLLSVGAIWRTLHRITAANIVLGAASIAGLALTKMSSVVILPILLGLVLIRLLSGIPTEVTIRSTRQVRGRLGQLGVWFLVVAAQALIVVLLIWATYGFRYAAMREAVPGRDQFFTPMPPPPNVTPWDCMLSGMGSKAEVIEWARDHRLLPEAFLYGFAKILNRLGSEEAFLNGQTRLQGWWYFLPYCFLVKTPLPVLGVLSMALAALLVRGAKGRCDLPAQRPVASGVWRGFYVTAPLWSLIAIYGAFALNSNVNLGERYILPVYVALVILAGYSIAWMRSSNRATRWLVPGMVGLSVLSSFLSWPNYLAHFNYLAGGSAHGYRHLVDSSLDWGQDLPGLKRWLEEQNPPKGGQGFEASQAPTYLAYFGTGLPSYYGIQARMLPGYIAWEPLWGMRLTGGVYCISATMLHQLRLIPMTRWTPALEACYRRLLLRLAGPSPGLPSEPIKPARFASLPKGELNLYLQLRFARLCAHLRLREPEDSAGYSILIYRVSDEELQSALTGTPAELVLDDPDDLMRLAADCHRAEAFEGVAICYEHLFKTNPGLDIRATAGALGRWGSALLNLGRLDEAASVLRRGLQLEPNDPSMANDLAWILATAPADNLRDGREALRLVRVALEASSDKGAPLYDTLAAAHAEMGQFDEACKQAAIALELAEKMQLQDQAKEIAARLDLYRSKKPYRGP